LQAWRTLPSCLANSSSPTLARMIFCSLVIVGVLSKRRGRALRAPTTPRPASASASAMTPTVRLSLNYCSKAIAIHATPASANPSKANRRFRAFLLPRVGLRRLMITALALSATAIRHHGLTDKQNDRTRRRFKRAKVLPRPGGSSRPAGGRNPRRHQT
jgi:hypothetical protein